MVKFQTIKQKARIILNSDDAIKSSDSVIGAPTTDAPITFDPTTGNVIDTTLNQIFLNGHKFVQGDEVVYTTTGTAIAPLGSGSTNYIIYVNDDIIKLGSTPENAASLTAIDITSVGSGEHTIAHSRTFLPSQISTANSIRITSHTFETGTPIIYTVSGGDPIDLLTNNETYYAINNSTNTIKLSISPEDAENGIYIPIVAEENVAGVTHTIKKQVKFTSTGSPVIDITRDQINIPAHNLQNGDKVIYKADTGAVGGLSDNYNYHVVYVDPDSIKLAYSYQDAIKFPPIVINITGVGTGTNHTITRIEKYVPICNNYKFKLENLPLNLNDKCRLAVEKFDYVNNFNTVKPLSVGGLYLKNISPVDLYTTQGYYNGNMLLSAYFGNNISYDNPNVEQNSIALPHNIKNILQNGLDVFVDAKIRSTTGQISNGNSLKDSFSLCLLIYELEDFEYITNELKDGVKHYIMPKEYL